MASCGPSVQKLNFVELGEYVSCETIAVFNTGAGSKAVTMKLCHVTPGVNTMKALREQDQSRIKSASQKISSKYRKQRRNLRAKKKRKGDDTAYQAGGFSLSSYPEKCNTKKTKGRGKNTKGQNSEKPVVEQMEIAFVQPEYGLIHALSVRNRYDVSEMFVVFISMFNSTAYPKL